MHTPLLRAFRSAALGLHKQPITTRTGQFFHASACARAADESSSSPRDDGNKPEKNNGAEDGDNGDINLFGDNPSTASEETQGRKKAGINNLRSRLQRTRKPEELPPVHVPKSFISSAISRIEDAEANAGLSRLKESEVRILLENALLLHSTKRHWENLVDYLMENSAWTETAIDQAVQNSSPHKGWSHKKGDIFLAAAFWATIISARRIHGEDIVDELLERHSISSSGELLAALNYGWIFAEKESLPLPTDGRNILRMSMLDAPLEASTVSWFEEAMINEIVAFVNTDLLTRAPKNVRLADLRRPVTIFNISDYSGYSVPRDIVRHISAKLEADVLHLRAGDIAHILGNYLGQDPARAPGPVSQLGYRAAANSGRLKPPDEDNEEPEEGRVSIAAFLHTEKPKRDTKTYLSVMDDFLNGTNRGKNDELWEDLKVNAALEELIRSAESESTERPLIVHIDDFNAINTDQECGAMIINRIRKIVDGLWVNGRKIALIGSCSTKGAPKSYVKALRDLGSTERVTNISMESPHIDNNPDSRFYASVARKTTFEVKREFQERKDYIKENESNLARVLSSMVEPPSDATITTTGEIGLSELDHRQLPKSWVKGVLPLNEIYRIATTMIGYSKNPADVFNKECVEKAADTIKNLERLKEKYSKINEGEDKNQKTKSKRFIDIQKLASNEENHEERMESGLVNAKDIRTTFDDVHAPKETIESVKMLTTLSLIRPDAFSYGVLATDRIPGCLLYGPPGTGKTLLAKAVAKQSGANMIEISGASINNRYVGDSEKNVRALFRLAKKKEPMVIFIDEADALLGARGRRDLGSRRETINQFLREWDGMDKMKAFIMVATNRPFDLDDAVLRRLPRKLLIDLPLEKDRAAILKIHLKEETLEKETVSIEDIAKRTPLYSGSDLKNVCVAAAMAAVKEELEMEQQQQQQSQHQTEEESVKDEQPSDKQTSDRKGRRILAGRHFDKALREIGASMSEDMATLTAIRKFDEKFGDGVGRRRKGKGMGFEVVPEVADSKEARVRRGR
ncbi:AAA-domain-containing protein [Jackrogersella minutella]|nr:AAA-domain-containing protein [Jackrogersella minutella]